LDENFRSDFGLERIMEAKGGGDTASLQHKKLDYYPCVARVIHMKYINKILKDISHKKTI